MIVFAALALAAAPAATPKLMVLGSVHLGNPGHDVANVKVENTLSPRRQREIATMVDALARWRPTRVAVEWPATEQAKLDRHYADYRAGRIALEANEIDQIGLRLAAKLGLARVDAVDWNEDAPGKDADYDYPAWAKANGQAARWADLQRRWQADADAEGAAQRCTTIGTWYRASNAPDYLLKLHRTYYDIATFGDPGAAWDGTWYARNLRIFGNLRRIATPSDRVLVVYGAGHGYFLNQFARESNTFVAVDPRAYLPPATRYPNCR